MITDMARHARGIRLTLLMALLGGGCGGSGSPTSPSGPASPAPACSGTLIAAVIANNSACVAQLLAAQPAQATGDGLDPISPLVAAAALGRTPLVELLLPRHTAHIDLAAVAAAGGRPNNQQRSDTIEFLARGTLGSYARFPTLNFALGIAILRNQTEVINFLRGRGINTIPDAFSIALNNPMNSIDRQLSALGAP